MSDRWLLATIAVGVGLCVWCLSRILEAITEFHRDWLRRNDPPDPDEP